MPQHSRLADFLPYQLSTASNAVSERIAAEYRSRFGLKIAEWRVMAVLGDAGAQTQRALAEATLMDKVAVNRACKTLEEKDLLIRRPNHADGRSHILDLTVEGRAIYEEIMPLARSLESELLRDLDEGEREALKALLARVRSAAMPEAGKPDGA